MDKDGIFQTFEMLHWCRICLGEMLILPSNDFNFKKKTVCINKSFQMLNGGEVITDSKIEKDKRMIHMPDFLCEEMKDYISRQYALRPDDRIFPYSKSRMPYEMDRGSKIAGVKRILALDLQHSHASLLISMVENPLIIMERLGHEKIQTTLGTYGHLYPNSNHEVATKLTGIMKYTPAEESVVNATHNQFTADYHVEVEKNNAICNAIKTEKSHKPP